jgi:hypothetical protein
LSVFNFKAFLLPALLIVSGIILWLIVYNTSYNPAAPLEVFSNPLLLLAEILAMIGLAVAFLMGVWVMTLVRVPGKRFAR